MAKSLLILCFLLFANTGLSVAVSYEKQQVWRLVPEYDGYIRIMREIGEKFQLDFWKDPMHPGMAIDFRVMPEQVEPLQEALWEAGIWDWSVMIPDVQALLDEQKHQARISRKQSKASFSSISDFDYTSYHTPEEVYEWMDIVERDIDFAKKTQFGITYQGRPLYVLEFKKTGSSTPKPIIFVDALIHCREWISTASLLYIFKEMLTNPEYSHMMNDADWYFVPMINVDGYTETWSGDRLWRKTKSSGFSSVCAGVDANRNWDTHWSEDGASPNPCSYTYFGPQPASESEVRHLADYIMGLGPENITAYVTTHSYSQLILYAYGWTDELPPDNDELNKTSKNMHDAMIAVDGKYYTYGPSSTTIYKTSGTTADWTYDVANIVQSYTFELRDTGRYGFLLPADQIVPNGKEYLAGLEVLKNEVVTKFRES